MARPRIDPADLAPVPWGAIQPHYCAGIRSLEDIGREFGVSKAAIHKHARKHGWERDLKARIQARAEAKVNAAAVTNPGERLTAATERETVEANAQAIVTIRLAHRKLIGRARGIADALLTELGVVTHEPEVIGQVQAMLAAGEEPDTALLRRVAEVVESLPGRAKTLVMLLEALRSCIGMEREAFGLDTADGAGRPMVIIKDFTGRGDPDAPARPAAVEGDDDGDA